MKNNTLRSKECNTNANVFGGTKVKSAAEETTAQQGCITTQLFQLYYFQRPNKQTKKYLFQHSSIDASAPSLSERSVCP